MRTTPESPLAPRMRATARRSVVGHDLQLDVDALPGAHHAEQAADALGAGSSSAAGFGSVRAAAFARAAGRDALLAGVRRGLGFAASSVASALASSPTCRSRRTTVSEGCAPLLIQVRIRSASIFT